MTTGARIRWTLGAWLAVLAAPTHAEPVVFVAGGSGRSGIEIVKQLVQAGYPVKASTRDADRARARFGVGIDWVTVDLLDPSAAADALKGVDVVVSALGHGDMVGIESPQVVHNLAIRNLIDAAKVHKVDHFVLMSSATAGHRVDHRLEPRFGFVLHWMTKSEDHLIGSGIPYTIVGPGGLVPGEPDKVGARIIPRAEYQRALVSRTSVAHAIVQAVRDPAARGKAFALVAEPGTRPGELRGSLSALTAESRMSREP